MEKSNDLLLTVVYHWTKRHCPTVAAVDDARLVPTTNYKLDKPRLYDLVMDRNNLQWS